MSRLIDGLKEEAKKEFLGWGSVVGVGVTDDGDGELVFLLQKDTAGTKEAILNWASQHSVRVQFMVTGNIRALGGI